LCEWIGYTKLYKIQIERNGNKPPLNEQGWKATVMVKSKITSWL